MLICRSFILVALFGRPEHGWTREILRIRRERDGLALSDIELALLERTLEALAPLERVLGETRSRSLRARIRAMRSPPRVILRQGAFH